jgi:hypothetical protein
MPRPCTICSHPERQALEADARVLYSCVTTSSLRSPVRETLGRGKTDTVSCSSPCVDTPEDYPSTPVHTTLLPSAWPLLRLTTDHGYAGALWRAWEGQMTGIARK